MVSDMLGGQLHDRVTREERLSDVELAQLNEWYASHDKAETLELDLPPMAMRSTELQAQIDAALARLAAITKRIQELAIENDLLRQDVIALRCRVP